MRREEVFAGTTVPRYLDQPRSVIGSLERTVAGNLVLRVGHENYPGEGWHQTEHVVLTREEVATLIGAMIAIAGINPEGWTRAEP